MNGWKGKKLYIKKELIRVGKDYGETTQHSKKL